MEIYLGWIYIPLGFRSMDICIIIFLICIPHWGSAVGMQYKKESEDSSLLSLRLEVCRSCKESSATCAAYSEDDHVILIFYFFKNKGSSRGCTVRVSFFKFKVAVKSNFMFKTHFELVHV